VGCNRVFDHAEEIGAAYDLKGIDLQVCKETDGSLMMDYQYLL
jgi:hypothetical protein